MKIVLGICCVIALSKALPIEDIDSVGFYPTDPSSHRRVARQNNEYYGYPIPTNPYYVFDVQEGIWKPRCSHNTITASAPRYVRQRANRRQGIYNHYRGHSQTFEALRGAIAFG